MRVVFERFRPQAGHLFYLDERVAETYTFNLHHHQEYELTLITDSRGRRFVGDSIEDYGPGDLVLMGPYLPHTYVSAPRPEGMNTAVVIQFSEMVFAGQGPTAIAPGPVRTLLEQAAMGVHFSGPVAERTAGRMTQLRGMGPVRQLAELLFALDDLAGLPGRTMSTRTFAPRPPHERDHPIDPVCRYLNEHFTERIALGDVARVAGMSVSAFCRLFKLTTGKTMIAYLNELRIGHACRLLVDSDRGIADIAQASGFGNLSHFNERFLAHRKTTPRDYRRAHRPTHVG